MVLRTKYDGLTGRQRELTRAEQLRTYAYVPGTHWSHCIFYTFRVQGIGMHPKFTLHLPSGLLIIVC